MVEWMTVLAACQLAGEVISAAFGLPVPGPVCGMAILFMTLVWRGSVPDGLAKAADGLLGNLSLLFVPAGAGVMLHFKLLAASWLSLSAALIVSTLLTIAVTASLMSYLSRPGRRLSPEQGHD